MFQIILLPKTDYWEWVRATREYVLTFGAHLTPDPRAAAQYMAPRQVVTFPLAPGGYPEAEDIESWFRREHPNVRVDPIEAGGPSALEEALARRIADDDRFGQKQRPFFLLWPTEYPVITQRFGANARIYTRFGMPGHEGVDFRALPNTKIFACADGEVYRVENNPKGHAYGIHVRIRHRDGYRTIYGHLAKALVKEGDQVTAGQVIGRADATGASVGHHLHLSLKRDYATERGETNFPQDIVDPTNLLVWPEAAWGKGLARPDWPIGKCLVGAHGRIDGPLEEADLILIEKARLEGVVVSMEESSAVIERLRARRPAMFLLARATTDFSDQPISPNQFIETIQERMGNLYEAELRYFELCPNPNLQSEGWGRSWADGAGFAKWFAQVTDRLRDRFPESRLGFPGLSPGGQVPGKKADPLQFLEGAEEATLVADWVGVNCYWRDLGGMEALTEGRLYQEYQLRYPDKLLIITEFGNPSVSMSSEQKAGQYLEFYRRLRGQPGIAGAFCFAISALKGYASLVWREQGKPAGEIVDLLAGRSF